MEFRWVAIIALWTILSGPIFAPSAASRQALRGPAVNASIPTPPPR